MISISIVDANVHKTWPLICALNLWNNWTTNGWHSQIFSIP
jgi:hypothetical protein